MKLPEIDEVQLEIAMTGQNHIELAQLHCLRSIAVSLEVMAGVVTRETKQGSEDHIIAVLSRLRAHSVREPTDAQG